MKKLLISLIAAVALLVGCTEPTDVATGGSNTAEGQNQPAENEKRVDANFNEKFKYVDLNVKEIVITPTEVKVGMNYENISNQKVSFYPDQGHIVIGDMQLDVDFLTQTSLQSGEVSAGVKSDGVLVFKPKGEKRIDVDNVTSIKFDLGEIYPDDYSSTKKVEFEISIK